MWKVSVPVPRWKLISQLKMKSTVYNRMLKDVMNNPIDDKKK